jgi:hypothetical protein
VFIDETWASTEMARTHGRSPRGEHLRAAIPHAHWKTTTFVAGLRTTGMVAPPRELPSRLPSCGTDHRLCR